MSSTMRLASRVPVASPEPSADPPAALARTRDNLAARCAGADDRYPEALDDEARALVTASVHVLGTWTLLRGLHTEVVWREIRRGLRHLHVFDLFRLARSQRPEARVFVREYVRVLAEALGYDLTPRKAPTVALTEAAARLQKEAGEVTSATLRALTDGHVDLDELDRIEAELADEDQARADMRAAVQATRAQLTGAGVRR